jgi:dipeptidyl aminopeptidase/acylaminoacyl peptidase
MRRVLTIGGLSLLVLWALVAPAHGSFPGLNGKIALESDNGEIVTVNANGTGRTNLTQNAADDGFPAWSPDGDRIAFSSDRDGNSEIYVMNGDGSGVTRITNNPAQDFIPAWSPDGSRIAFVSFRDGNAEIYATDADGTNPARLTNDPAYDSDPDWSPDGQKIAFDRTSNGDIEIYVMNADGSGQTNLSRNPQVDGSPSWSPDGTRIAFDSVRSGSFEIWTMDAATGTATQVTKNPSFFKQTPVWSPDGKRIALEMRDQNFHSHVYSIDATDGSGVVDLTPDADSITPDWQRLYPGYPRPRGASPTRVSLVPAFKACTAPNRTHGAPLAFPSCDPPQQASAWLTLGTADSNGQPTEGNGSVRYKAVAGDSSTPQNEADLKIAVSATDVLHMTTLLPYTGELSADAGLRITDRNNTPSPSGLVPATVQDTSFPIAVPCSASLCSVTTSANTLVPGAVVEGKRAIWQLGQVQVYDGGADGVASTHADNTLFLDQGVLAP